MSSLVCVYAVVPGDMPDEKLAGEYGIDGEPLELVRNHGVGAIISKTSSERLRPTRAALTAHEKVTSLAHRLGPSLPVRFGTLLPGREAVARDLLGADPDRLRTMLREFTNRDEYRLRARYLTDVALTEVVARSRQVQKLRKKSQNQAAQIQLGEAVVSGIEALRAEDGSAVMKRLASYMVAWRRLADGGEDTAVHVAMLVDRERAGELEAAVEDLGEKQRERLHFELIGPLAPWDFTALEPGAA